MWRIKHMRMFSTRPGQKAFSIKRAILTTSFCLVGAAGALLHQYRTNNKFRNFVNTKYLSKTDVKLNSALSLEAINVMPENLHLLRSGKRNIVKFVQFCNSPITVHPHYFYYRKTLILRGKDIPLYVIDLEKWQDKSSKEKLIKTLCLNESDLLPNSGLHYALINKNGDMTFYTNETPIDPVRNGLKFLEGPPTIYKAEDLAIIADNMDNYEHTCFVIYTDKGGVLANCYNKLFCELGYNLQQICSFVEINDPVTAKELGIDTTQPGLVYTFHTLSTINENSFPYDKTVRVRNRTFGVSHSKSLSYKALEEKYKLPYNELNSRRFEEIYKEMREYIIYSLGYQRNVQYCPNIDYLKLLLTLYKDRKDSVLYIAVNPGLISLSEFEEIYKSLANLHKEINNIRIVLTDAPNAKNFTWIIPRNNEKVTVRLINFSNTYKVTGGTKVFTKIENAKTEPGKLNFIEKYRLEADEMPSNTTIKEFMEKCNKREVEPYRECDTEASVQSLEKLNTENYRRKLNENIKQDRVVICYCPRCAKCRQVLDAVQSLPETEHKVFLYNIANESDLNVWAKAAPALLYFPKGSTVPTKMAPLTNVIVGRNADKELIGAVKSLLQI